MRHFAVLEQAIARAAEDEDALLSARMHWNVLAGEVHDEEPLYEERVNAFLEWFLLEYRPVEARALSIEARAAAGGAAPERVGAGAVEPAIRRLIREAPEAERPGLIALAAAHRGLFTVREPVNEGVLLEDLWGGGSFRVYERRRLIGLGPGEVFEARLVADVEAPPRILFTRSFCFHPREALEIIRQQVVRARRAGERRDDVLFRLLRSRLRCERYRHLSPLRIYESGETREF
ncbi:MAG TPA: hypothetical protein VH877_11995 [Polyangia bacterium]|jgi:hypothetical protein|nr:hypothetical protein [Polyangia bacterium]